MKAKLKLKWTLDVLMTIALLFLMGYQFWGEAAHEWIGAGMFVLFISHQVCNLNWYKNLFSLKSGIFRPGKYTPMCIIRTVINFLALAAMLMQIYSGIILSRHVFAFLPIQGGTALARRLHVLGSYWGFLFMSLHLGLHWGMILNVTAKIRNRDKAGRSKSAALSHYISIAVTEPYSSVYDECLDRATDEKKMQDYCSILRPWHRRNCRERPGYYGCAARFGGNTETNRSIPTGY